MKKELFITTAAFFFFLFNVYSEDITTIKGNTYSNVIVTRAEPDGISIRHSTGIAKIFFSELSQETQHKYGYNRERHQRYIDSQLKERLINDVETLVELQSLFVEADLHQIIDDGALSYVTVINIYKYTNTFTDYDTQFGNGAVVKENVETYISKDEQAEPILIVGISDDYVDGDSWTGTIYKIGTYTYTTVRDTPKKIGKYTSSKIDAMKAMLNR